LRTFVNYAFTYPAGGGTIHSVAVSRRTASRRLRERALVLATRDLFDERGMQDAPVEDIARAVGIARGLIYRHFSSKEELYVLTVTTYLDELARILEAAVGAERDPARQAERCLRAYADYCMRFPAFLDCSLSLMHGPARDLRDTVSDSVWLTLGQGMARCLDHVAQVLRRGTEAGVFAVDDPDYMANVLWTQTLGTMHLARLQVGVRQRAPGVPALFPVTPEQIVETCVSSAMATVSV
jgi:AcrR family transcriptional regulator